MIVEKPIRVVRTAEQEYDAPADTVFPLLCPVREKDWVAGWDPEVVWSDSGVNEPGCVFTTRDGQNRATWITIEHDAENYSMRLLKVNPDVNVCDIRIQLIPDGPQRCRARLSYGHTALGPRGVGICKDFTESFFARFSERWQKSLSNYLHRSVGAAEAADG